MNEDGGWDEKRIDFTSLYLALLEISNESVLV